MHNSSTCCYPHRQRGEGEKGRLSYTSPQFASGTSTSTQRTRYKINNMETFIHIFLKFIPCPFPLTTTQPNNSSLLKKKPKKNQKEPQTVKLLPMSAVREGSRGDLSYIWTSMFHYVPIDPSKGLGTK